MFRKQSRGQEPAEGSAGPGEGLQVPRGRHALGAPRSETSPRPPAANAPARADDQRGDHGGAFPARRVVRFSDLQVAIRDGTVFDAKGRLRAVGPLLGARARVTVLEPDLRKPNLVSWTLGHKKLSMISHLEITVTVGDVVLTRSRDANGAGTALIRSAKKEAAEFNDLARRWSG